jgi:hypothetical protein
VAALLRQLFELCLMRRGPQDLPFSTMLTAGALAALLAFQAGTGLATDAPAGMIVSRLAVTVLLLAGVTPWLLRAKGFGNRVAQTLLAQAGAGLLFSIAMLPAALALMPYVDAIQPQVQPPPQALVPALAALVLFVWKLRVDAAIWRQALELRPPLALALAIGLVFAEMFLLLLLAPAVPASGS